MNTRILKFVAVATLVFFSFRYRSKLKSLSNPIYKQSTLLFSKIKTSIERLFKKNNQNPDHSSSNEPTAPKNKKQLNSTSHPIGKDNSPSQPRNTTRTSSPEHPDAETSNMPSASTSTENINKESNREETVFVSPLTFTQPDQPTANDPEPQTSNVSVENPKKTSHSDLPVHAEAPYLAQTSDLKPRGSGPTPSPSGKTSKVASPSYAKMLQKPEQKSTADPNASSSLKPESSKNFRPYKDVPAQQQKPTKRKSTGETHAPSNPHAAPNHPQRSSADGWKIVASRKQRNSIVPGQRSSLNLDTKPSHSAVGSATQVPDFADPSGFPALGR